MKQRMFRAMAVAMLLALSLGMGCTQNRDGSYSITVQSIMEAALGKGKTEGAASQAKGKTEGASSQADDGVFQTGTYIVPGLQGTATLRRINANTYAFAGQFSDGLHPTAWSSDKCRPKGDTLICETVGRGKTGDATPMNVTIRQPSPGKLIIDAPLSVSTYLCGAGLCFSDLEYIKK